PAAGDRLPRPAERAAPGTADARRVAEEAAVLAAADDQAAGGRGLEVAAPLGIRLGDDPRHPPVLDAPRQGHGATAHDQCAARHRRGPAHVHGDLGVPHLAAAAGPVVVAVHALHRVRAVVVDGAAELADVLDHHAHPVRVPLAEVAAARVVGAGAAQLD